MYSTIGGTNLRILGSMHWFPAGSAGCPKIARDAYEWATDLVFEHAPTSLTPYFHSDPPVSLEQQVTPDTWTALLDLCALEPSVLDRLRPWAATANAVVGLQRMEEGIEALYQRWAAIDGKSVSFLETGAAVIASFETAPLAELEQVIQMLNEDREWPQRQLETAYAAWAAGDREALFAAFSGAPLFRSPALHNAMLVLRNRSWVPVIEALPNRDRRTLIVVGAAHLLGPENLEECLGRVLEPWNG